MAGITQSDRCDGGYNNVSPRRPSVLPDARTTRTGLFNIGKDRGRFAAATADRGPNDVN
jgi:hypothetical protein